MKKLIELDAALEGLENLNAISFYEANEHSKEAYMDTMDMLKALPTVDAVPVVHGRWKAVKDGEDDYRRICSCCGEDAPYDESDDCYLIYPHCPWCGAKMDGKDGDRHV